MALLCRHIASGIFKDHHLNRCAQISTSSQCLLNQNWRTRKGLPENPNKDRILLELPDYSYTDGRPTPYGSKQRLRIEKQRQYTAKIVDLTAEIDLAVRLDKERVAKRKASIADRINNKLTQKGNKTIDS